MLKKKIKKIDCLKNKKSPIVCISSYTAPIVKIADKFADLILVGDSVGPVLYGHKSTREVTIDIIIEHAKAVVKNTKDAIIVIDMPYGTYETNKKVAYDNSIRILSESGADAVKLEGGEQIFDTVDYLVRKNINVMGHIGMLPQQSNGKYYVYGKTKKEQNQIFKDLKSLENAGVFSVVIECTVHSLVDKLLKNSTVPIIGIGATSGCDGQILVAEDLLGLTDFESKFLKKYVNLKEIISNAFKKFSDDVKKRKYPIKKNYYK